MSQLFLKNVRDWMIKYSIFQEHSHSRFVYYRFSGDLFPVVMIEGDLLSAAKNIKWHGY